VPCTAGIIHCTYAHVDRHKWPETNSGWRRGGGWVDERPPGNIRKKSSTKTESVKDATVLSQISTRLIFHRKWICCVFFLLRSRTKSSPKIASPTFRTFYRNSSLMISARLGKCENATQYIKSSYWVASGQLSLFWRIRTPCRIAPGPIFCRRSCVIISTAVAVARSNGRRRQHKYVICEAITSTRKLAET